MIESHNHTSMNISSEMHESIVRTDEARTKTSQKIKAKCHHRHRHHLHEHVLPV